MGHLVAKFWYRVALILYFELWQFHDAEAIIHFLNKNYTALETCWKPYQILKFITELFEILAYFMTLCHEWPCMLYKERAAQWNIWSFLDYSSWHKLKVRPLKLRYWLGWYMLFGICQNNTQTFKVCINFEENKYWMAIIIFCFSDKN